jgi:hypothetical protein
VTPGLGLASIRALQRNAATQVRNASFVPCLYYHKNDHFTKTGLGASIGKTQKETRFLTGEWGMGWCNPVGNETSLTSSDTSVIWPAAGMALAPDEQSVLSFAVTAPFTHGGLSVSPSLPCPNRTACSGVHQRTQVEMLKQRLDGFVSVDADYLFDNDTAKMPGFTTRAVAVPNVTSCEAPATELQLRVNLCALQRCARSATVTLCM